MNNKLPGIKQFLHTKIVETFPDSPLIDAIQRFHPILLQKADVDEIIMQHLVDIALKNPEKMKELYSGKIFLIDVTVESIDNYPFRTFIEGVDSYFILLKEKQASVVDAKPVSAFCFSESPSKGR